MKSPPQNVTHLITFKSILIFLFILSFPLFNITNAQSKSDVNTVIKELNGYVKEMKKAKKFGLATYGHKTSNAAMVKFIGDNGYTSWAEGVHWDLKNAGLFDQFGIYGLSDWLIGDGSLSLILKSIIFVKKYKRYDDKKLLKIRNSIKIWKKNMDRFDKDILKVRELFSKRLNLINKKNDLSTDEGIKIWQADIKKEDAIAEQASQIVVNYKYAKMPPFESLVEKVYVIKNIVFDGGPLESYLRLLKDQINYRIKSYKEYENKTGKEIKDKISKLSKKQNGLNNKAKKLSEALKKKTNEILSAKRAKFTPLVKAYIGTRKLSQEELTELENKIIASYEKGRHSKNTARFKRRDEILKYIDKLNATIKSKTQDDAQLKLLEKLNNEYLKIDNDLWNMKKEQYKLDSDYDIVFYSYDKYREELDKRVEAIDYAQSELQNLLASTANSNIKYIFINASKSDILKAVAAPGLEKEKLKFKNLIKKLNRMKKNAKRIRDKALRNFVTAREEAITAGESLSGWRGLIMKRALTNAAIEFTQNIKDVIIDGGKEGIPGMLAALAGKSLTFYQDYKSGKLTKDDIDYKAIKKRVKEKLADTSKVLKTSIDAANGHIKGEILKMLNIKNAADYLNDFEKKILQTPSPTLNEQIKNIHTYVVKYTEEQPDKINDKASKLWAKRNNSLKKIEKDLSQIKIGDKFIREIGRDLTKGAAIEFFKAGISQHLKQEEINGWKELFEKDIIADGLFAVFKDSEKRLNRVVRELQKVRKDLFNLTRGMEGINPYLVDFNNGFFETDKLQLQILSKNMKDINQRVYIDKVEATKVNNDNFTLDAKKLGKDTPEKIDLKIVFSPKR